MYLAHKVFSIYRLYGAVAYRHYIENCIDLLLGDDKTLEVNLPSTARVSLMDQPEKKRFVLHLLYAEKTLRGGHINMSGGTVQNVGATVEVIEDLLPIYDTDVVFVTDRKISKVTVEPQGRELDFTYANGKLSFNLDKFTTHAMLALQY